MTSGTFRIGTRQSRLAMVQTQWVADQLQKHFPAKTFELVGIMTQGDQILDQKLDRIGGKGLFIKELERALLKGDIDFAVHSAKDLPARLAPGTCLAAVSQREDPRDVLLSPQNWTLESLPEGAVVGTASARREMLLQHHRPDLQIRMLRGNVQTRLAKLEAREFDAIVLAAAGLHRLGLADQIGSYLNPQQMIPAVGQGILAVQAVQGNAEVMALLEPFHHGPTWCAFQAERAVMLGVDGDCSVPLAAYAALSPQTGRLSLQAAYGGGAQWARGEREGLAQEAEALGTALAQELLEQSEI